MHRSLPALLVAFLAAPSLASGQTAGERLPSDVTPGLTVSVVEDDGRRIEGRVREISERGLILSRGRTSEEIRLDRIVRIEKPDSLKNGALAGLGFGLALGAFSALAQPEGIQPEWVFAAIVSNGIACTLLGTGIDALVDTRRTLYERGRRPQAGVAPVMSRGTRGAALSIRW